MPYRGCDSRGKRDRFRQRRRIHLDWRGLADPQTTLVFYMGGRTAPAIAERLIAAGLSASTPAVVTSGVSRQDERRWCGQLAELAQGIGTIDRSHPVLIGIGRAFAGVSVGIAAEPDRDGENTMRRRSAI